MRPALLGIGLGIIVGCATAVPPELLGRWRSDEERTLADIDERALHTPEQRAALDEMFGDLTYEFRPDGTYDWMIDGHRETVEYRIIEVGPGYVEFEGYDSLLDEVTPKRIWWEGRGSFWIWAGSEKRRFKEYFRREP